MKLLIPLLAGILSIGSSAAQGTGTAQATAYCYSLRFQRGIDPEGNYYLDLSSFEGGPNGELALDFFSSGYTHSSYLSLTDELLGEALSGRMALDVPSGGDQNRDGFPDFFQAAQGVTNLASSGLYDQLSFYGNGSVTASWNRPAGSKDGTCVLTMQLMPFQPVAFSFGFELIEYQGPLTYTPAVSDVAGQLNLEQTGNSGSHFAGGVKFTKSATDRFNELALQPGIWTNELQQPLAYRTHLFARDAAWPTNYYGYLEFYDTNNPTGFYPYGLWMLSIDDLNDANHNGIPDFSDAPASVLPRRPTLSLQIGEVGALALVLHGEVGHLHEIQSLSDFGSGQWQLASSVTLTNDPQTVILPPAAAGARFWRVKAQ